MKHGRGSYRRCLQCIILLVGMVLAQPLWADCSFTNSTSVGRLFFAIPAIEIPQDVSVGTVLYTGISEAKGIKVKCNASGPIYQGYKAISDNDYQASNPLEGVYATNVPGIGMRASWVNSGTASFSNGAYIKPFRKGTSTVSSSAGTYSLNFHALLQLVVTGDVKTGTLDTNSLKAEWQYDNLTVATLGFYSNAINVKASTCNLVEKSIVVPLKTVTTENFVNGVSPIVSGNDFKIQLTECGANLSVDIKFSSNGTTGVTNGNTLNIAGGDNAAKGIGIQLFAFNEKPLTFDYVYLHSQKTVAGQTITIPLKARYVKTGQLQAGEVNALATFEINYR